MTPVLIEIQAPILWSRSISHDEMSALLPGKEWPWAWLPTTSSTHPRWLPVFLPLPPRGIPHWWREYGSSSMPSKLAPFSRFSYRSEGNPVFLVITGWEKRESQFQWHVGRNRILWVTTFKPHQLGARTQSSSALWSCCHYHCTRPTMKTENSLENPSACQQKRLLCRPGLCNCFGQRAAY